MLDVHSRWWSCFRVASGEDQTPPGREVQVHQVIDQRWTLSYRQARRSKQKYLQLLLGLQLGDPTLARVWNQLEVRDGRFRTSEDQPQHAQADSCAEEWSRAKGPNVERVQIFLSFCIQVPKVADCRWAAAFLLQPLRRGRKEPHSSMHGREMGTSAHRRLQATFRGIECEACQENLQQVQSCGEKNQTWEWKLICMIYHASQILSYFCSIILNV